MTFRNLDENAGGTLEDVADKKQAGLATLLPKNINMKTSIKNAWLHVPPHGRWRE